MTEIMNKIRILIASFFIIIIIIMCAIIYINKDTIFRNEINITYPDGCVEYYLNGQLQTPECVEGRQMESNTPATFGENISWQFPLNITMD